MRYKILVPKNYSDELLKKPIYKAFDNSCVNFISDFSKSIFNYKNINDFSDLIALGYWMRKSHLLSLKKNFLESHQGINLLPRGTAFHITPSNVDVIFVYSWFISMLMGNINIIKLSSKSNEQISILIDILNKVLNKKKYESLKKQILIIQYENTDDETTSFFSSKCDVRIIWGGDETINKIRNINIKPNTKELVFTDKFSFSLIDAKSFNFSKNKLGLVNDFFKDSYSFLQMACSSPKLIVWYGENNEIIKAKEKFWDEMYTLVEKKYSEFTPSSAIKKLTSILLLSMKGKIALEKNKNNSLNRVFFKSIQDFDTKNHFGGGLFYEIHLKRLIDLNKIVKKNFQTMSYFGFNSQDFKKILGYRLSGIDRIVPIGKSHEFSHIWDGYNLFRELSRQVYIE